MTSSGDNFDLNTSLVLSALIRRFVEAKKNKKIKVVLWGTGKPKREFMHVDDCAEAILFANEYINDGSILNIGPGTELTTYNTAKKVAETIGYNGEIILDTTKLDGTMRKKADSSKIIRLGWTPKISFEDGLSWLDPAGRTRTETELGEWKSKRASAGKMAPRGFPRNNKF